MGVHTKNSIDSVIVNLKFCINCVKNLQVHPQLYMPQITPQSNKCEIQHVV